MLNTLLHSTRSAALITTTHHHAANDAHSYTHKVSKVAFDTETHSWLQKLYEAWSSNAPASTFASIRDSLLDQLDHVDNRICILSSFAKIARVNHAEPDTDDASKWAQLFSLASSIKSRNKANAATERKRKYNETNRLRNLALVAALWSPKIVFYYDWNNSSQAQMNMLRACATRYPRFFQEFRPRLNAVLLARHCQGIQDSKTKTLNEAPLQPHRDLNLGTLASAVPDDDIENEWVTNTDGNLLVDAATGTTLKDVRPSHYHHYLLRRDCYGLIAVRGKQSGASPTMQTPSSISMVRERGAASMESLPTLPVTMPTQPSSSLSSPLHEPSAQHFCLQPEFFFNLPTPPLWSPSPFAGSEASGACVERHHEALIRPASVAMEIDHEPQMHVPWPSRIHDNEWCESELMLSFSATPQNNVDDWTSSDTAQVSPSHDYMNLRDAWPRSLTLINITPPGSSIRSLAPTETLRLDSPAPLTDNCLCMEEVLQTRYLDIITKFVQRAPKSALKPSITARDPLTLRKGWLSPSTPWARVWTEHNNNLVPGRAESLQDAEVLFLTSDEAMRAAQAGEIFTKPIVIKEKFSDAGMHRVGDTIAITGTDPQDDCAVAIELQNITRSHRPLITMLPRFRLLESLVQRIARKEADELTHMTSFTTLSHEGACSRPRLVGSAGVWMRNLDGTKFVSFVPETEVLVESAAVSSMGMGWDPKESQRFVLLEQDDVFLIPPGIRVIYTHYSPTQGVMEGGFFWDCSAVLNTFRAAEWIHAHQLSQEDTICPMLPKLITAIELLVAQEPNNFRGDQSKEDFFWAFQSIVSNIRLCTTGPTEASSDTER